MVIHYEEALYQVYDPLPDACIELNPNIFTDQRPFESPTICDTYLETINQIFIICHFNCSFTVDWVTGRVSGLY